jgi:hypothetical protein
MRKSKLKVILSFVCVFVLMFILAAEVLAYSYMGTGKWPSGNVRYAIATDIDSSYVNPTIWAAGMWTDNSNYKLTRNNSSQINVMAYKYGEKEWDGMTYVNSKNKVPIDETYSYANIQINRTFADSYDDVRKKLLICHEFGHTASLFHVRTYTMMYENDVWEAYQNNPSLRYSPSEDDIMGINNRY